MNFSEELKYLIECLASIRSCRSKAHASDILVVYDVVLDNNNNNIELVSMPLLAHRNTLGI